MFGTHKPTGFIPSEDDGNIYVTFQLPPASSTAQSVGVMTQIMKVVAATPGSPLCRPVRPERGDECHQFQLRHRLLPAQALG